MSKKSNSKAKKVQRENLQVEKLEHRDTPSVSALWMAGSTLVVKTDNADTSVQISQSGTNYVVKELNGLARSWTYSAGGIGEVEFQGGAGKDRFIDLVGSLRMKAYGNGGNDYLEGYNANDYFDGGAGNDIIKGYGGDDTMFGGDGDDVLLGMSGNDQMVGGNGNDLINGRDGADKAWGDAGNDVIIAIDNAYGDYVEGGAGKDILWVDAVGTSVDRIYGAVAEDKVQRVASFANGADKTLDGDRIADPTVKSGYSYRRFDGNPLFSSSGPSMNDIKQGDEGDCWLLAGVGAIAQDNSHALRQNIVDFSDGTYGVRLGDKFYRVDNDFAANSSGALAYAKFGAENSAWVAVVEKAYAHYRTGANSYASLNGGWSVDVNRAFGSTTAGAKNINSYANATDLANDVFNKWNTYQAVTIGFLDPRVSGASAPIITRHMYTVANVIRNSSGVVTQIVLRNPWGRDGAGSDSNVNDGYVTVTPAQIFQYYGQVNWGRIPS